MTSKEAIERMKYRIDTAAEIAGRGEDGKAFEDMELAIEALEKHIPKKPITSGNFFIVQRCPACDVVVPVEADYCMKCGQRIIRDEE